MAAFNRNQWPVWPGIRSTWGLDLDPASFEDCRTYRDVVAGLFRAWARSEGKTRWGDKTPQYVAEIPTLLEIFPESKLVHIYRDGRDVALSWLKSPFGAENLYSAAKAWHEFVSAGRSAGRTLDESQYIEVCYESLLHDPEGTMKLVYEFLQEPEFAGFTRLNYLERRGRYAIFGARDRRASYKTEIGRSNSQKWKQELSQDARTLFESVAGDLLEELGYETDGSRRKIARTARWKSAVHQKLWSNLRKLNSRRVPGWIVNEYLIRRTQVGSLWRRPTRTSSGS